MIEPLLTSDISTLTLTQNVYIHAFRQTQHSTASTQRLAIKSFIRCEVWPDLLSYVLVINIALPSVTIHFSEGSPWTVSVTLCIYCETKVQ